MVDAEMGLGGWGLGISDFEFGMEFLQEVEGMCCTKVWADRLVDEFGRWVGWQIWAVGSSKGALESEGCECVRAE